MRWNHKKYPNQEVVRNLEKSLNIPNPIAVLLAQRGVTNFEEAKTFFRPSLENLHDPFLMKDMDKAVERIEKAINTILKGWLILKHNICEICHNYYKGQSRENNPSQLY